MMLDELDSFKCQLPEGKESKAKGRKRKLKTSSSETVHIKKARKYSETANKSCDELIDTFWRLSSELKDLRFPKDITVYDSYDHARVPAEMYFRRFISQFMSVNRSKKVLFVGMNPGPWGMVQTGVPFGDVGYVRDWMKLEGTVSQPPKVHPKRPVKGFGIGRGEVSGKRLWGLMKTACCSADDFFSRAFVYNYCPLAFFRGSRGTNVTPDRIPNRKKLLALCDSALKKLGETLKPSHIVGVGKFAFKRVQIVFGNATSATKTKSISSHFRRQKETKVVANESCRFRPVTGLILHPSPASPKANRGWDKQAVEQLKEIGCWDALSPTLYTTEGE
mmetsp:Transcript_18634/g.27881  ORF Transcript_18634/g.27881 Transcript_18634/m.27881 type:complete len:334 (+) Transcript_18634:370-1371(+)